MTELGDVDYGFRVRGLRPRPGMTKKLLPHQRELEQQVALQD
jgi:hypothetical protein